MKTEARAIAFYLPQYHPIPENNEWWGAGFTEWTNVAKAKPLFRHHYQPHLPADLGFYDLRLVETREQQAQLAREHGISGFCYYHYWFNGKRLLERPFNEVLESGTPDFPFCLCWANESWRRNWDGLSGDVLLEQRHDPADDVAHIQWLIRAFKDPRYIRIEGKPLILIYRANLIGHIHDMLKTWRSEAKKAEVGELYICRVESSADERGCPLSQGFDAAVEFQPDWALLSGIEQRNSLRNLCRRFANKVAGISVERRAPRRFDYENVAKLSLEKEYPSYVRYPCVTPMWDNTARKGKRGLVLTKSTPEKFELWTRETVKAMETREYPEPLVFVNAWNEWAEGNHLEPCQQWGTAYLMAVKRALLNPKSGRADHE